MEENKEKNRKLRRNAIDENDVKRWSDLPNELLESVLKRLFFADQQNLRAACKSWSSIQEERIDIPPLQQMPWLLLFDEHDSFKLIDSKYKKTYTVDTKTIKEKMNMKSFIGTKIHESRCGWLLISSWIYIPRTESKFYDRATSLLMYSPFNNNFIELPILTMHPICLAAFTASNPFDDDCTVVTLNTTIHMDAILVGTYRRGQSSWNSQVFQCEFPVKNVKCWMYSQGKFYYTTDSGGMGTFDLARKEWNVFPSPPLTTRDLSSRTKFYMVKPNDNELFLIVEESSTIGNRWYSRNHVCKLHLLWLIWEDSNGIGDDRVLFVGDGYNWFLNSSVLESNGVLHKGTSNTIYYCLDQELTYCTVDKYPAGRYNNNEFFPRQPCSRHYGRIAGKQCMKLLIDPPSSSSDLNKASW